MSFNPLPIKFFHPIGISIVFLMLLLLQACKKAGSEKDESAENKRTTNSIHSDSLITDKADRGNSEQLVMKLCAAIKDRDAEFVTNHFDHKSLMDSVFNTPQLSNLDATSKVRANFEAKILAAPGGVISNSMGQPIEFLRLCDVQGQTQAVSRIISNGRVNYYGFIPKKQSDGSIKIVDIYDFSSGELISTTFQNITIPFIADATNTPLEKLYPSGRDTVNIGPYMNKLQEMVNTLRQGGDLQKGVGIFKALPASIQNDRTVLQVYTQLGKAIINSSMDSSVHEDAMLRFERYHSEHPGFFLLGIEYYLLKKDMANYYSSIDSLDRTVGGDPYLDFYRATGLAKEGKVQAALSKFDSVIAKFPDTQQTYWNAFQTAMAAKQFQKSADYLTVLTTRFNLVMDLDGKSYYSEFIKSEPGSAWWSKYQTR